jgi:hypothetical protein
VAVVRKFSQGWKVSRRPKSKLTVAGQGKCEFLFTSHDLERKGGRMYRLRAFFVAGAVGTFTWEKVKRGVSWSPGLVLQPLPGQQVLCRLVYVKWAPARLPLFWGDAFVSSVLGKKPLVGAKVESAVVVKGTRSGRAKIDPPSQEPQGANLCRAAGLGASVRGRLSQPRKRTERASSVLNSELEGEGETEVVGDILGRKLTGAMAARGHDALAECSRCALQVPISDALVCVFREKDIVFTDGQSGGHCGLALCTDCFNEDIDEEQYPDWRDEPQSLLTAAHARLVYNFVCPQCRYDICCNRVVPPRDDVQYRYLISLITQYLVDVTSHLARNTVGSYGQHINVFMDFFAAAPELDSGLVFGVAEVDLVVVANCTMLGMLMLHRANEGLTYNGIRGLRSAVWKSWSTRCESPPTDQLEFKNFMKALCERMGDEVGSKWAMPVEVMQALVALATEDANGALLSGELDLERELRTKAMYYLVCFLIWPRPGEQRMMSLKQIASDAMYPQRAERLNQPPHLCILLDRPTKKSRIKPVDAVIAWHTLTMKPGPMMMNLIQAYERTGVGLDVSFPHCGIRGKHFGRWSPWYALHMILRPDLQRLKDEGMPLLSELNVESDVILRCFRTGGVTHAGDRQAMFQFSSYLIDVHKRKDNMRGKQGKESTRQTYDSQPMARRLVVTSKMA